MSLKKGPFPPTSEAYIEYKMRKITQILHFYSIFRDERDEFRRIREKESQEADS